MNISRQRIAGDPGISKMIKFALVALFAMSMATLALAASALPVDTTVPAAVSSLG